MIMEQEINKAYVRYHQQTDDREFIQTTRIKNGVLHVTNYPSWMHTRGYAFGKPTAKFRIKSFKPKN